MKPHLSFRCRPSSHRGRHTIFAGDIRQLPKELRASDPYEVIFRGEPELPSTFVGAIMQRQMTQPPTAFCKSGHYKGQSAGTQLRQ
jgi:hypothetical protein